MEYKEYILHQLREMRRELLTALEDVTGDDLTSFEPCGHWPVAWIAEHCSEVADGVLCGPTTGEVNQYAEHVANWFKREPAPGDAYPSPTEICRRWSAVCDSIIGFVENASDEDLQKTYGKEPYIQSILRVVNHTNSHLRSLWCILGERRVDHKFAEQQPWLA